MCWWICGACINERTNATQQIGMWDFWQAHGNRTPCINAQCNWYYELNFRDKHPGWLRVSGVCVALVMCALCAAEWRICLPTAITIFAIACFCSFLFNTLCDGVWCCIASLEYRCHIMLVYISMSWLTCSAMSTNERISFQLCLIE